MFLFSKGNFPWIPFCRNYVPAKTSSFFYPSHQNVAILQHVDQKRVKDVIHNNTTRNKESLLLLLLAAPLICCPLCLAKSFSWRVRLSLFHCAPLVWLVVVLPGGLPQPLSRQLHLLSRPLFVGCCMALRCDACATVVPPTIFKALVVSPTICAAAAACIIAIIAIWVVTIVPLASGVGGDGEGALLPPESKSWPPHHRRFCLMPSLSFVMETATNPWLPCQPAAAATTLDDNNDNNKKANNNTATVRKWLAALPRSDARMTGISSSVYPPSSLPGGRRGCCPCCVWRWSFHHPSLSPSPSPPLPSISLFLLLSLLSLSCWYTSSSYSPPPPPSSLTSSLSCWRNHWRCHCWTKWRKQHHHHKHTDNNTEQKLFHKSRLGLIFMFWQKRNMFLSVPLRSDRLFLDVPAIKKRSSFFLEPRFLRIPGNSGDSCRNAQPRYLSIR